MKRKTPYVPRAERKASAKRSKSAGPKRSYSGFPRRSVGEIKGVDSALDTNPVLDSVNTNGSMVTLNLIAPGSGSYNRIGRKLVMKSLRLKVFANTAFAISATGDLTGQLLRMVVVYDKQPNGVVPTFDTVFGVTNQAGTESTSVINPLKYDQMSRFRVVWDKTYDLNAQSTGPANADVTNHYQFIDEYIKLPRLETVYQGQSATCTIADIATGALYIFFRATTNGATTAISSIGGASMARLRYEDA